MSHKKSSLVINDIFEELIDENKRLLNELSFAYKLNRHLNEFKTFVDLNSTKLKLFLNSSEVQKYDNLNKNISEVLAEYIITDDINCEVNRKSNENNVIKSEEPNHWSEDMAPEEYQTKSGPTVETKDSGQEKGFECDICHKKFTYKKSLTRHHMKHSITNTGETYVCEYPDCGKTFAAEKRLSEHVKNVHKTSGPKLVCGFDGCKRQFKNKYKVREHFKNCHLHGKRFICDHPGCDYKSENKQNLQKHQQFRHSDERPFVCSADGCHKAFSDQKNLNSHMKAVHSDTNKHFRCHWPGCEYSSAFEYMIRQHQSTHSQERHFKCDVDGCQSAFKTAKILYQHKNQFHKMGKQLSCQWPGCDFTTFYTTTLREHSEYHRTGGQYACEWPDCGRRFVVKQNLEEHINTVHKNVKPYVCPVSGCSYRTAVSGNFSKHMKKHNN